MLDAGRIGQPVAGTAMMMVAGHERWHPNPDFYYAGPGAGPLYDMGPYYITAMVNLLGPVRAVSGMASRLRASRTIASGPRAGESIPVDARTHVAGVMEFENDALIQIATSFDVPAHGHTPLELYGTTASMKIPDPNRFDGQVMLSGPDGWQAVPSDHDFGGDNHRALGLADMADAILTGRPHRASGDLALHVLDVIASLLQSARTGRTVTLTSTCARPEPMRAGALTHLTAPEAA
ncbi:Gfo/Idh/MocA family protein [Paracoccus aerius]